MNSLMIGIGFVLVPLLALAVLYFAVRLLQGILSVTAIWMLVIHTTDLTLIPDAAKGLMIVFLTFAYFVAIIHDLENSKKHLGNIKDDW